MQAYPWPQLSAHVTRQRDTLELPTRNTTKEKRTRNMTKNAHVAPPVGTIYRLSHVRWHKRLREDEY